MTRLLSIFLVPAFPLLAGVQPTFHADVEPLLQKHCQQCHRPGESAPMSLLSYDEVRPWARAIQEAVALDRMPPWFADPRYGEWSNAHVLAPTEKQMILDWVESGAARGDPAKRPEPRAFVDGWNIGKPDLVLEMPEAFRVPEEGTIDYQYVVIPTGLAEDKWVTAAEVRPDNREVVHHVIAYMRPKDSVWLEDAVPGKIFVPDARKKKDRDEERNEYRELLAGFAPGMQPFEWSDGNYAKMLPVGADIVLQMHYTASGEEAFDQTRVGFRFLDKPPAKRVVTMSASNGKLVIPPGAGRHPVEAKWVLNRDVELVSVLPHMHLRGKDFRYDLRYPDGRSEVLLSVPKYDFEWQYVYYLRDPKVLPAGTAIDCLAHFDNSPNNPDNPDPSVEVRWGDQSWEEMMIGFFDIAVDAGADLGPYLTQAKRDSVRVE
ncbi:MAG: thiol-disulfide isomerase [Bryobacterales bacterium]|nr:thiol-disulfide isomerase [Bryobacterales bacterium]